VRHLRDVTTGGSVGCLGVIADFDDTLADTRRHRPVSMAAALVELGCVVRPEEVAAGWGTPFPQLIGRLAPHIPYEDFEATYLARIGAEGSSLISGASDFLFGLSRAGVRIAVLTAGARNIILREMEMGRIDITIDVLFAAEDTKHHKPDVRVLDEVMGWFADLDVTGRSLAYVGDSVDDGRVARAAGLEFYAVLTGSGTREEFARLGIPERDVFCSVADSDLMERLIGPSNGQVTDRKEATHGSN
jgi:phosphoglycolate phosphatase